MREANRFCRFAQKHQAGNESPPKVETTVEHRPGGVLVWTRRRVAAAC